MATNYQLSIITPEGKIFDDAVTLLVAKGKEGNLGVLANHTPIIVQLKKGVLQIKKEQQEQYFALSSGVLEVGLKNRVLILANEAIPASNLNDATSKIKDLSSN